VAIQRPFRTSQNSALTLCRDCRNHCDLEPRGPGDTFPLQRVPSYAAIFALTPPLASAQAQPDKPRKIRFWINPLTFSLPWSPATGPMAGSPRHRALRATLAAGRHKTDGNISEFARHLGFLAPLMRKGFPLRSGSMARVLIATRFTGTVDDEKIAGTSQAVGVGSYLGHTAMRVANQSTPSGQTGSKPGSSSDSAAKN
jgi:hypothetical protein